MLDCLMNLWFGDAKMQSLKCDVFEDNYPALKLYEAVGFKTTKPKEERLVFKGGKNHKIITMVMHTKDYRGAVSEV